MVQSRSFQPLSTWQELRICLGLATPLAAAQLAHIATGFVDTVMMGQLGSHAIAAGGLGATAFNFLLMLSTGVVSAVSPLVAEAYGANQPQRMRRVFQQGLITALGLSLVMMLILSQAGIWLPWIGQTSENITLTRQYLNAVLWAYPPALTLVALRSFVAAVVSPRPIMVIGGLGTLINIAGNYTLALGKFGLPALGLTGIGLASVMSFIGMTVMLAAYSLLRRELRPYCLLNQLPRWVRQEFWELLRVGLPIGGLSAVEGGLFTVATFLISQFGTVSMAAHQIALQTSATTFMVALGVSMAATIRVGHLLGQGQKLAARRAGFICIALGGTFMGCMAVLFWIAPTPIVSLYLDVHDPANRAVVAMAETMLGIAALFQLVDGIQVTAAGSLRGLKDTRIPLLIGIVSYWCLGLFMGYLLARPFGLGGVGYWWGMAVGLLFAAVILTWRFGELTAQRSLWFKGSKI